MDYALVGLFCVQAIAENFPISSSTQVALAGAIMIKYNKIAYDFFSSPLWHASLPFFHIPTIVIIILFFKSSWTTLLRKIDSQIPLIRKTVVLTLIADSATLLFYCIGKAENKLMPFYQGQLLTTMLLIAVARCPISIKSAQLTHGKAFFLGCMQGCALILGISRLAVTYVIGRFCGLSARKSFATSWMIFFPLLCADFCKSLQKWHTLYASFLADSTCITTIIISTIVGFFCFCGCSWTALENYFHYYAIYTGLVTAILTIKRFCLF